jgi:multidrug resistance efflux pump
VTRRLVAAPFEGCLEKALVKPGDVVATGDLLARMDPREIRWKLAALEADHGQAIKKRDAAQAGRNYAEAQIAALDARRLELELKLWRHREANLEIRSPIGGVVASGDLERVEGVPLETGQALFEIAPLEQMVIELAIPDDDIAPVNLGQTIVARLDAYPDRQWQAVISQIQPRAEIRDQQNVFIAEAVLENSDGRLRPGMEGYAKVETPPRAVGWIALHRVWERMIKLLQW